jgi:hypothetical protein
MPDTIAPPSDPTLRALALANAGEAVAALAAHLAEAAEIDTEEVAEQLLNAGLQVLLTRRRPEDARILAELGRWLDAEDEPAAATGRPLAPDPAAPWCWRPSAEGDLVLLDEAGAEAARIQVHRISVLEAADPEAEEPYRGIWSVHVRNPDPALPAWRLTALDLADAYRRADAALDRATTHWHHPAAEVPA